MKHTYAVLAANGLSVAFLVGALAAGQAVQAQSAPPVQWDGSNLGYGLGAGLGVTGSLAVQLIGPAMDWAQEAPQQLRKVARQVQDLTKPVYAGKIVMPNPASSGTGFLDVSAWLQIFGEEKGWAYMDALHKNIGSYTHSGSKPCNLAAAGEFPIGVSFDYRAAKLKADGAPVEAVFPSEGLGWEVEATAIVKGTKHLEAARKLAEENGIDPNSIRGTGKDGDEAQPCEQVDGRAE